MRGSGKSKWWLDTVLTRNHFALSANHVPSL
jgi:hypothetical protein